MQRVFAGTHTHINVTHPELDSLLFFEGEDFLFSSWFSGLDFLSALSPSAWCGFSNLHLNLNKRDNQAMTLRAREACKDSVLKQHHSDRLRERAIDTLESTKGPTTD